jgi:hypothetical protein
MPKLLDLDTGRLPDERLFPSRFGGDERLLKTSMQAYGLLRPPRLWIRDGELTLLDGSMRLLLAREIGIKTVNCFVHENNELDLEAAFLLCVEANSWDREFNVVEKGLMIQRAHEVFKGKIIPKIFWHSLKVPQNIRTIQQYKDLLRLPFIVQKYSVNNHVPLPVILEFLKFRKDEVEKVANKLFVFPLSQNRLAEILGFLLDICKQEERSPLNTLDHALGQIGNEGSAQQKEIRLCHVLNLMCKPNDEAPRKDFEAKNSVIA